jgi:hypothetical protein
MGRFQASNGAHYGVELSADQVSSLIDVGAGLVGSVVNAVGANKGKNTRAAPAKKRAPAPVVSTGSRSAAAAAAAVNRKLKQSNTALWIGGGVVALTLLGVTGWALTRGR